MLLWDGILGCYVSVGWHSGTIMLMWDGIQALLSQRGMALLPFYLLKWDGIIMGCVGNNK